MAEKRIMIVDDEKDVLTVLEKRLSHSGYSVIKADNGKDALVLAKNSRPDLILLDIMMPGMDGAEVGRILKNDPQTKDIPIVFLTCLIRKEEEEKGAAIGGNYFIAKPYNPDELLQEISKHIKI